MRSRHFKLAAVLLCVFCFLVVTHSDTPRHPQPTLYPTRVANLDPPSTTLQGIASDSVEETTTTRPRTTRPKREGNLGAQAPQEQASYEPGTIERLIFDTFGTSSAISVARCESGLRPDATNGQYWGLFQIGTTTHAARIEAMGYSKSDMLTPGPNIAVAYAIYSESGWRPWSCKP